MWLRWILASVACSACLAGDPITVKQGFPFVDVLVNGEGPFRMLIDTGATTSILTPKAAREAGVELDHRMTMTTFAGERIVPGASQNHIQVGAWVEKGQPLLIMDVPEVRRLESKADGVLGQSFFSRMPFLLDYRQKQLWLGDEATAQAARLPFELNVARDKGRLVLPVTLEPGGEAWLLTLDSGATNLVVECSERCPRSPGSMEVGQLITHAGERPVTRKLLRHIEIAGQRMPPADVVLLDDVADERWDDGVIPTRWFSAFYVHDKVVRFIPAR